MSNTVFLAITNSRYMKYTLQMLKSFNKFHSDVPIYVVAINLSPIERGQILSAHANSFTLPISENFRDLDHEKGYCVCCRTWMIKKLMGSLQSNVFYFDVDVVLHDKIDGLLEVVNDYDFAVRAKQMNPFRCNAGMVWIKYSTKNLDIITEWIESTKSYGIKWMSDQLALNDVIQKHFNEIGDITYTTFPTKYNGISTNEESVIKHYKGPKPL